MTRRRADCNFLVRGARFGGRMIIVVQISYFPNVSSLSVT